MLRRTTRLLTAILCLQVAHELAADEYAPPPDERILKAWRRQQEFVTSAKFLLLGHQSVATPAE